MDEYPLALRFWDSAFKIEASKQSRLEYFLERLGTSVLECAVRGLCEICFCIDYCRDILTSWASHSPQF